MTIIQDIRSVKTYKIIGVSKEMKVFYAEEISNPDNIEYFPLLDVSAKDIFLVKVGNKVLRRVGYIDSNGTRTHASQLEFV